jgi:hypothetical protein
MFLENNYAFGEGAELSTTQIDRVNNMLSEAFEHILIANMVDTSYAIQEESQYLLQEGAEGFWNRIKSFLKMIWEAIKNIWENIVSFFKGNSFKNLDDKMKKIIKLIKDKVEPINKDNHAYSPLDTDTLKIFYDCIQEAQSNFITIKVKKSKELTEHFKSNKFVAKMKAQDITKAGDASAMKDTAYTVIGSAAGNHKDIDSMLRLASEFESKTNRAIYKDSDINDYYAKQKALFSDKTFEKLKKAKKILDENYGIANDYYNVHKSEYNENTKVDFTNFINFLKISVKECGELIKCTKQALSFSIKVADNTLSYYGQRSNIKDKEINSWHK